MSKSYEAIIAKVKEYGSILDVMLTLQREYGYLTEAAINAVAKSYQMFPSQVYETATFYGMLKLKQQAAVVDIRICRGAPCHVAGSRAVIETIEKELGITIGNTTEDGYYYFGYTECLGQCQASPALLANGVLYTNMTPEKAVKLIHSLSEKGGEA